MAQDKPSEEFSNWLILICVSAIVLADVLFYGYPLGWTLALYAFFLLCVLLWRGYRELLMSWPGRIIAAATFVLMFSLVYQPDMLNSILTAMGLVTLGLMSRSGWTSDASIWGNRFLRFIFAGGLQVFRDLLEKRKKVLHHSEKNRCWGETRSGKFFKFLPIGLLALVFIGLFAAANPVIASWLDTLGSGLKEVVSSFRFPRFTRVLLWGLVGIFCWGLLRYRPQQGRILKMPVADKTITRIDELYLNAQNIVVALALFNIIFGVQNMLDIGYLWGGAALPEGMTYAEYAHRGAYPLVATALLAAAFVLLTFRPNTDTERSRFAQGLVYLWIAQNVFLTASAGWRLNLYVEVYSLTKLRVAAAIWMGLVVLGLVWICVRIIRKRSNLWLVNVNAVTLIAVLYLCAFVNFSGFIAWYNCKHCNEVVETGPSLDFDYLNSLGPEAIPALYWVESAVDSAPAFADKAATTRRELAKDVRNNLSNWRGWTWRRDKLRRIHRSQNSED